VPMRMIRFLAAICLLSFVQRALASELVSFSSLDGSLTGGSPTELHGLLIKPEGSGPFPAVVALHGCGGLFDKQGNLKARESAWGQLLTSNGYAVLFPDSFGPRGVSSDCEGARVRAWAERSFDAYGALRYLQAQPYIIGDHIGLMGWSHGGATTMFVVAPRNVARPTDLPEGDFRAAVAFYPAWCGFLGNDWTPKIPLLLEIGLQDDSISPKPCVDKVTSAIERGSPAQIKTYDDAVHDFDWPGDALHAITSPSGKVAHYGVDEEARLDALVRVREFFDAHLKP
jgi:dienelactone hydrolase